MGASHAVGGDVKLLAFLAVLTLSVLAPARLAAQREPVEVHVSFFLHGNDYLKLSEVAKGAYVTGVVDGPLDARAAFGALKKRTAWLEDCVVGMSSDRGQQQGVPQVRWLTSTRTTGGPSTTT